MRANLEGFKTAQPSPAVDPRERTWKVCSPASGLEGTHGEGHSISGAQAGVCHASSNAPVHCLGAFLTDGGPEPRNLPCPYVCHQRADPLQLQRLGVLASGP